MPQRGTPPVWARPVSVLISKPRWDTATLLHAALLVPTAAVRRMLCGSTAASATAPPPARVSCGRPSYTHSSFRCHSFSLKTCDWGVQFRRCNTWCDFFSPASAVQQKPHIIHRRNACVLCSLFSTCDIPTTSRRGTLYIHYKSAGVFFSPYFLNLLHRTAPGEPNNLRYMKQRTDSKALTTPKHDVVVLTLTYRYSAVRCHSAGSNNSGAVDYLRRKTNKKQKMSHTQNWNKSYTSDKKEKCEISIRTYQIRIIR